MDSVAAADLGVIKTARRRQRRRRALAAGTALVATVIAAIAVVHPRHTTQAPSPVTVPAVPPSAIVAPDAVFSEPPYVGVPCPPPGSIACDKVGIAIQLRSPAQGVTATIAGRHLRLFTTRHQAWGRSNRPLKASYGGFLQPAGLLTRLHLKLPATGKWFGSPTPVPLVRFLIHYGHGNVVVTEQRVPLREGFS